MELNTLLLFSLNPITLLSDLFGEITRLLYLFFGNYGLAIVALTIIVRGLLIPLNVRSQRSMIKQQALSSQQAEIKRRYPDDKKKQQEELTKLYSENHAMSFSGCILPFVQIFFIWPIYAVVRAPLYYLTQVKSSDLKSIGTILKGLDLISSSELKNISKNNIPILRAFHENSQALQQAISDGYIKMGQVIDMNFFGLDLSKTPAWNPTKIFTDLGTYLPLLIIPLLVVLTTVIQMQITTHLRPNHKEEKLAKERAKKNPARAGQTPENSMETTMKMMNWMMPAFMLITTFTLPAAMGFYWIAGNLMGILQQYIVYFLFNKPFAEKKAEMEIKKEMAFTKSAVPEEEILDEQSEKRRQNKAKK